MVVTATGYEGVYDGNAHGITVSVTSPTGTTIKYGTTSGSYTLNTNPTYTAVGEYTVYYQVTKANYNTVTGSKVVKITAKAMTASDITVEAIPDQTYTGSAITPTVIVKDGTKTLVKDTD